MIPVLDEVEAGAKVPAETLVVPALVTIPAIEVAALSMPVPFVAIVPVLVNVPGEAAVVKVPPELIFIVLLFEEVLAACNNAVTVVVPPFNVTIPDN